MLSRCSSSCLLGVQRSSVSRYFLQPQLRPLTSSSPPDDSSVILQRLGDHPWGTREYRLVLRDRPEAKVASLRGHRNMLFGACLYNAQGQPTPTSKDKNIQLSRVCLPLLDMALDDANLEGEQPQALATLHGLCDWVKQCLENTDNDNTRSNGGPTSETLRELLQANDQATLEAVRAIATGIPRPGHSVVGQGTYRDGQAGWESLAKEFIVQQPQVAQEVALYQARGGNVVEMEHLADTHPDYLKSAGGTMARLFFL